MIPAYILHPQQRAGGSKRLIRSQMLTLAQALQTCGMVHAEAVFPAAVKIHRQNRAAAAAEQNISDADRRQTLFFETDSHCIFHIILLRRPDTPYSPYPAHLSAPFPASRFRRPHTAVHSGSLFCDSGIRIWEIR